MSGTALARNGGRVLVGLALCLCAAGCDSGEGARGPAAATEGESAALSDARQMLDERPPAEAPADGETFATTGNE